jgi:hypothetical protein
MSDYLNTWVIHIADSIETLPKGILVKLIRHLLKTHGMSMLQEIDQFIKDTQP